MTSPKPQLDALTGARGIAAWYVVFYHVREAFGDEVPQAVIGFLAKGYLAVDLFFILSGFVMWLNYGAMFEQQGLRAAPDFLRRRFARIYPLHFVILLAMVIFVAALGATGRGDPLRYPLQELPLHFLLIQNWGLTSQLSWNDPAWSISTEFAAYLALPFGAAALVRFRRSLGVNLLLIAGLCLLLWQVFAVQGQARLGDDISGNGLIRCLIEFFIGVLVCSIWQQADGNVQRWLNPLIMGIGLGSAALWSAGVLPEPLAVPALFAATVYGLAQSSGQAHNPLSSKALIRIGDISYSTYLVHFFLWIVFKLLFVADPSNVSLPLMMSFFALTYAASEILYRFVENPGRKWVQSLGGTPQEGIERSGLPR